ncbi:hypothetical protein C8F01DRAFT_643830 [Mycena amicta]|nr:hypothetical protein C8F01DRAFT_643830 [Mycena amicta]
MTTPPGLSASETPPPNDPKSQFQKRSYSIPPVHLPSPAPANRSSAADSSPGPPIPAPAPTPSLSAIRRIQHSRAPQDDAALAVSHRPGAALHPPAASQQSQYPSTGRPWRLSSSTTARPSSANATRASVLSIGLHPARAEQHHGVRVPRWLRLRAVRQLQGLRRLGRLLRGLVGTRAREHHTIVVDDCIFRPIRPPPIRDERHCYNDDDELLKLDTRNASSLA